MSHLPPNHWSNLEKYEDLFEVIIFPDLPTKKKELSYPEDQRPWLLWTLSKVKATKKWNSYVQRITVSWFWFHAIHTSSSLWILASINQQNNLSQTSSTHGMLIVNKFSKGVAPGDVIPQIEWFETTSCSVYCWDIQSSQTPKWFHYQRFQCCRDQQSYHIWKQCLQTSRKTFQWIEQQQNF